MLVLSRKKEEKIIIDDKIKITIVNVSGDQVKIGIEAPDDINIYREEIYSKIEKENIKASKSFNIEELQKLLD